MKYITVLLICFSIMGAKAEEKNMERSGMLGLRTVSYEVRDLDAAIDWYSKAFGIKPYFTSPQYVGFSVRGFELGLMPGTGSTTKGDNVLAYWGVENIDVVYQQLIELGAKEHSPIVEVGGGIRIGSVRDPFGNVLGVIYNPIFKQE